MDRELDTRELKKERDYLLARLEEASVDLTRLDLLNLGLQLQRRQAHAALNFFKIFQERVEKTSRVEDIYRCVTETLVSDLNLDASALLCLDPDGKGFSVLASAGLSGEKKGAVSGKILSKRALLTPTFACGTSAPSPIHRILRSCFGFPYFVWYPFHDEMQNDLVLFAGNRTEDYTLKQPFSRTTVEIFGALSTIILMRKENIAQTRESLRKKEERIELLAEMLSSSPVSVIAFDKNTKITYCNPATEKLYGYASDELMGMDPRILIAEPDTEGILQEIREAIGKGNIWIGEIRNRKKNGEVFYVKASLYRLQDKDGNRLSRVCFQEDITESKNAEEALRQSERKYRELADMLPQIVCEIDVKGGILYANHNAFRAFGYSHQEFESGLTIFEMLVPEDRERAREAVLKILDGKNLGGGEYTALRKNGLSFPVMVYTSLLIRDGKVVGLRAIVVDITERKKLEEDLERVQRLESLSVLAGGIAHDFNNILTAVLGNISLAKMELSPAAEEYGRMNDAERAVFQAKELTRQLLTFAKGGAPVKRVASIEAVILSAGSLALRGSNCRLECDIPEGIWNVEIDEGQIGQVVNNLIINAKQAMPEGGDIAVSVRNVLIDREMNIPLDSGRYVKISIYDRGVGIPSKHLQKIFDPYFTTKKEGSGLGLAICHSVISRHNGRINVESIPGEGSTFSFFLPASSKDIPAGIRVESVAHSGCGRILVMDDQESIRDVLGRMLEHLGYEIEGASNGTEAIEKYSEARESGNPFCAVIMDLTVPGEMGGEECIKRLREYDPGVRAIVSSGYSNAPIMSEYRQYGFRGVITKPYRLADLSRSLGEVFGQKQEEQAGEGSFGNRKE